MRNDHQRWRYLDIPLPRQLAAWIIHRRQRQFLPGQPLLQRGVIAGTQGYRQHIAAVGGKRCHRRRGIATNSAPGRPDVQQQRLLLAYGMQIQRPAVECLQRCGADVLRQRGLAKIIHRQAHRRANQQPHRQLAQPAPDFTGHGLSPAVLSPAPPAHQQGSRRPPSDRR
ncbi:Uncharacterised protein [Klebsiella pneumoniae]|nr:Uncharacterised protein [Klebsiella pneumoniae]